MKKIAVLMVGAILGVLAGALVSVPFNYWYTNNYVRSDEDSNFLVSTLFFGFIPVFAAIGIYISMRLYHRRSGK